VDAIARRPVQPRAAPTLADIRHGPGRCREASPEGDRRRVRVDAGRYHNILRLPARYANSISATNRPGERNI
jgi:hypothetical protein